MSELDRDYSTTHWWLCELWLAVKGHKGRDLEEIMDCVYTFIMNREPVSGNAVEISEFEFGVKDDSERQALLDEIAVLRGRVEQLEKLDQEKTRQLFQLKNKLSVSRWVIDGKWQ